MGGGCCISCVAVYCFLEQEKWAYVTSHVTEPEIVAELQLPLLFQADPGLFWQPQLAHVPVRQKNPSVTARPGLGADIGEV